MYSSDRQSIGRFIQLFLWLFEVPIRINLFRIMNKRLILWYFSVIHRPHILNIGAIFSGNLNIFWWFLFLPHPSEYLMKSSYIVCCVNNACWQNNLKSVETYVSFRIEWNPVLGVKIGMMQCCDEEMAQLNIWKLREVTRKPKNKFFLDFLDDYNGFCFEKEKMDRNYRRKRLEVLPMEPSFLTFSTSLMHLNPFGKNLFALKIIQLSMARKCILTH